MIKPSSNEIYHPKNNNLDHQLEKLTNNIYSQDKNLFTDSKYPNELKKSKKPSLSHEHLSRYEPEAYVNNRHKKSLRQTLETTMERLRRKPPVYAELLMNPMLFQGEGVHGTKAPDISSHTKTTPQDLIKLDLDDDGEEEVRLARQSNCNQHQSKKVYTGKPLLKVQRPVERKKKLLTVPKPVCTKSDKHKNLMFEVQTKFDTTKIKKKRSANYSDSTGELAELKKLVAASQNVNFPKSQYTRYDVPDRHVKEMYAPKYLTQDALGGNEVKYSEPFDIDASFHLGKSRNDRPPVKIYPAPGQIYFYHSHNPNRRTNSRPRSSPQFLIPSLYAPITNNPLRRYFRPNSIESDNLIIDNEPKRSLFNFYKPRYKKDLVESKVRTPRHGTAVVQRKRKKNNMDPEQIAMKSKRYLLPKCIKSPELHGNSSWETKDNFIYEKSLTPKPKPYRTNCTNATVQAIRENVGVFANALKLWHRNKNSTKSEKKVVDQSIPVTKREETLLRFMRAIEEAANHKEGCCESEKKKSNHIKDAEENKNSLKKKIIKANTFGKKYKPKYNFNQYETLRSQEATKPEDDGQLTQAMVGDLANTIVTKVFDEVKSNKNLQSSLGPGLYRHPGLPKMTVS